MKRILLYTAAAGLLIGTGCSKKEEAAPPPASVPAARITPAEPSAPATAPAATTAESIAQQVKEQTTAAVTAMNVQARDVMDDLNLSVEAIREKVDGFSADQVLAYVDQYKTVLLEKKEQIAALTNQIKALPVTELMGDKAKMLKDRLSQYTGEVSALKERYTVYLDKLKAYGIDLSAYTL